LNWYNGHPTEVQQAILDAEIAIAEANLLMAELNWDRVKDGPDPDLLMEAKSRITRAEQQVEQAQDALLGSELYAPFSGVILEVNAIPGKFVRGGEGFILLGELSELEVVVTIIEEDFPQIEIGQCVELFFDATPESEVFGVVDRVVPRRLPGDRPLYAVYITFDHIPDGLVAGMTADASIITASVEQVLRLPKSLVKARTGQSAKVEVWMDGYREERNVQIGLRGDRYVEILYGLQVGEQVITE
jgi:RND family efflux transporter MFP subunit